MPKIKDIIRIIEDFAPFSYLDEYDNVGIMCGDKEKELTKALVTLDLDDDVIDEAIACGANLIIEHHPTIYCPIKSVNGALQRAIENKLTVYAAHTNVDFAKDGLNDFFMASLGVKEVRPIKGDFRLGKIGVLDKPLTLLEFAKHIKNVLNIEAVKYVGNPSKIIKTVAGCNGGAGDIKYLQAGMEDGADIFISADFKYHVLRLAKDLDYAIIDCGHYESEIGFIRLIAKLFEKNQLGSFIVEAKKCQKPYGFII